MIIITLLFMPLLTWLRNGRDDYYYIIIYGYTYVITSLYYCIEISLTL